jgi:hypothetical protein
MFKARRAGELTFAAPAAIRREARHGAFARRAPGGRLGVIRTNTFIRLS